MRQNYPGNTRCHNKTLKCIINLPPPKYRVSVQSWLDGGWWGLCTLHRSCFVCSTRPSPLLSLTTSREACGISEFLKTSFHFNSVASLPICLAAGCECACLTLVVQVGRNNYVLNEISSRRQTTSMGKGFNSFFYSYWGLITCHKTNCLDNFPLGFGSAVALQAL